MKEVEIRCFVRENIGKAESKRLRKQGFIPAVVYGPEIDNINISVSTDEFRSMLSEYGTSCIFTLNINDGKKTIPTIVKQIQRDYLGTDIIHLDFYRIYKDKEIHVSIPIVAVNRAKGEIEGGVLDQSMFSVEVSGLPVNVPPVLEVDVSNLEIGDNYTIGDLETPEGVKLLDSPDRVVFTVVPPKGMEIEEEVVAEEVEEEEAPAEGEEEGEKVEPSEESTT